MPRASLHAHGSTCRRIALALAALITVALIATPAPMVADSANVVVTARVSPTFSLTLLTSGTVDFGTVTLGSTHEAPIPQLIEVRSNRPWDFIDSSDPTIAIGETAMSRERILRHEPSLPFGTGNPPGIHAVQVDYLLDLANPAAFDIPPDAEITTTFGYTATQQ